MFPGLRRRPVLAFACAVLAVMGFFTPGAFAQSQVAKTAKRLTDGSSFQVRVQAALALGVSGSEEAVRPLCGALDDDVASVRAAAAAALGRLRKPSSVACLSKRVGAESNPSVRSQLQRALDRTRRDSELRKAASSSRAPTRKSRFYVAVESTKSKSARRRQDVELLVQATIREKLMAERAVGLAPSGQNQSQFEKVARDNRLQGYLLRPTVESIAYDGSNVTVAIRLTLFSYPSMALQAEYSPKLSMTGTVDRDLEAEDKLLQMAAEKAVEKFLQTTK